MGSCSLFSFFWSYHQYWNDAFLRRVLPLPFRCPAACHPCVPRVSERLKLWKKKKSTASQRVLWGCPEPRLQRQHRNAFSQFPASANSHLGTTAVWYNSTPSSSQAVEESVIWQTSRFTALIPCRSLPPSSWCLLWKQNISEKKKKPNSCFEAKTKLEQSLHMFLSLICLAARDGAIG